MKNLKFFQTRIMPKWKLISCVVATSFFCCFTTGDSRQEDNFFNDSGESISIEDEVAIEEWAKQLENGYLEVDFDAALTKKLRIPEYVLDNVLISEKLNEIRSSYKGDAFYCNGSEVLCNEGLSLFVKNIVGQVGAGVSICYYELDTLSVLSIAYDKMDGLDINSRVVSSYLFNKDRKLELTDESMTYYEDNYCYTIQKEDDDLYRQSVTFSGMSDYNYTVSVVNREYKDKTLEMVFEATPSFSLSSEEQGLENYYSINQELPLGDYIFLSGEMKDCFAENNGVGFLENNANKMKEFIVHSDEQFSDDEIEKMCDTIDSYMDQKSLVK